MDIQKVKDVVCGMTIDPAKAAGSSVHEGETYYFCGKGCKTKFDTDPARYLNPPAPTAATVPTSPTSAKVEYTCPMHPEIVQIGPGSCPICGMALEPKTVTLEEQPNHELADMTRRFWIAALLTAPVFLIAMSEMFIGPGLGGRLGMSGSNLIA